MNFELCNFYIMQLSTCSSVSINPAQSFFHVKENLFSIIALILTNDSRLCYYEFPKNVLFACLHIFEVKFCLPVKLSHF